MFAINPCDIRVKFVVLARRTKLALLMIADAIIMAENDMICFLLVIFKLFFDPETEHF